MTSLIQYTLFFFYSRQWFEVDLEEQSSAIAVNFSFVEWHIHSFVTHSLIHSSNDVSIRSLFIEYIQ